MQFHQTGEILLALVSRRAPAIDDDRFPFMALDERHELIEVLDLQFHFRRRGLALLLRRFSLLITAARG